MSIGSASCIESDTPRDSNKSLLWKSLLRAEKNGTQSKKRIFSAAENRKQATGAGQFPTLNSNRQ